MTRFLILLLVALTAASTRPAYANGSRALLAVSPEALLGFGEFCHFESDTVGCASAQGALGLRGSAVFAVSPSLFVGGAATYSRLPSQRYEIWKATLVAMRSLGDQIASGTWAAMDAGIASTTAIQLLENAGGGARTFHAPHIGISLGQSWNPTSGLVLAISLQGAVSLFNTPSTSSDQLDRILWAGLATTMGWSF